MDYFDILNFAREPFSNSPDPDFFYQSVQHTGCLQQLELAIRLRRGLNVVIGHVGTGKTTLCRELIRRLDGDGQIDTHLMLDPGMRTDSAFLSAVVGHFSGKMPPEGSHIESARDRNCMRRVGPKRAPAGGRMTNGRPDYTSYGTSNY